MDRAISNDSLAKGGTNRVEPELAVSTTTGARSAQGPKTV
jgi:hypothetical protein